MCPSTSEPASEHLQPLHDNGFTETIFPSWRTTSPEEFAARQSPALMFWGFARYTYPNPEFTRWIQQVTRLLASVEESERCRKQFLSPEKYERARAIVEAMKELGYWDDF